MQGGSARAPRRGAATSGAGAQYQRAAQSDADATSSTTFFVPPLLPTSDDHTERRQEVKGRGQTNLPQTAAQRPVRPPLWRWIGPGCLFFLCLFVQNAGLYIATYYYVMWMDRLDAELQTPTADVSPASTIAPPFMPVVTYKPTVAAASSTLDPVAAAAFAARRDDFGAAFAPAHATVVATSTTAASTVATKTALSTSAATATRGHRSGKQDESGRGSEGHGIEDEHGGSDHGRARKRGNRASGGQGDSDDSPDGNHTDERNHSRSHDRDSALTTTRARGGQADGEDDRDGGNPGHEHSHSHGHGRDAASTAVTKDGRDSHRHRSGHGRDGDTVSTTPWSQPEVTGINGGEWFIGTTTTTVVSGAQGDGRDRDSVSTTAMKDGRESHGDAATTTLWSQPEAAGVNRGEWFMGTTTPWSRPEASDANGGEWDAAWGQLGVGASTTTVSAAGRRRHHGTAAAATRSTAAPSTTAGVAGPEQQIKGRRLLSARQLRSVPAAAAVSSRPGDGTGDPQSGYEGSLLPQRQSRENLSSSVDEGSLQDIFADAFGRHQVSTSLLDMVSGMMPLILMLSTMAVRDLTLWTKCCLCAAMLAVLKGFLGFATVVPDSVGWEGCQARLGEHGLQFFRDRNGLNFEREIIWSVLDVVRLEVVGLWFEGGSHHLRFCADMMYSGHTYVCTVFALGIYDLVRNKTAGRDPSRRGLVRLVTGVVLTCVVGSDVVLILANRFHYTMDVVVALVLTLLMFSNPAVAAAAEFYAEEFSWRHSRWPDTSLSNLHLEGDRGSVLVPPCCVPLCCFQGRYHLHRRPHLQEALSDSFQEEMVEIAKSHSETVSSLQDAVRSAGRRQDAEQERASQALAQAHQQRDAAEALALRKISELDGDHNRVMAVKQKEIVDLRHDLTETRMELATLKPLEALVDEQELEINRLRELVQDLQTSQPQQPQVSATLPDGGAHTEGASSEGQGQQQPVAAADGHTSTPDGGPQGTEDAGDLGPGMRIMIHGSSRAPLNGKLGVLQEWRDDRQKWKVRLDDGSSAHFHQSNLEMSTAKVPDDVKDALASQSSPSRDRERAPSATQLTEAEANPPPMPSIQPTFGQWIQSLSGTAAVAAAAVASPDAGGDGGASLRLVVGSEAADADSIVSALSYGYMKHFLQMRDAGAPQVLPLVACRREDMLMRRETMMLLQRCNVNFADLLFLDDPGIAELLAHAQSLILVDHNQATGTLATLSRRVVEIKDHHRDLGGHQHVKGAERDIAFKGERATAGSCCTVIAEAYFRSGDGARVLLAADCAAVARALLGVILLDTGNLDPAANKACPRDLAVVAELSQISLAPTQEELFLELDTAKFDSGFWGCLTVQQSCRYDYNECASTGRSYALSSCLCSLEALAEKEDWSQEVATRAGSLDLFGILTYVRPAAGGPAQRQLMLCSADPMLASRVAGFVREYEDSKLGLETLDLPGLPGARAFSQANAGAGRRQIQSCLAAFFESDQLLEREVPAPTILEVAPSAAAHSVVPEPAAPEPTTVEAAVPEPFVTEPAGPEPLAPELAAPVSASAAPEVFAPEVEAPVSASAAPEPFAPELGAPLSESAVPEAVEEERVIAAPQATEVPEVTAPAPASTSPELQATEVPEVAAPAPTVPTSTSPELPAPEVPESEPTAQESPVQETLEPPAQESPAAPTLPASEPAAPETLAPHSLAPEPAEPAPASAVSELAAQFPAARATSVQSAPASDGMFDFDELERLRVGQAVSVWSEGQQQWIDNGIVTAVDEDKSTVEVLYGDGQAQGKRQKVLEFSEIGHLVRAMH